MSRYSQLRFPTLMTGAALSLTVLMLFLIAGASYWTCEHEADAIRRTAELEKTHGALLYYNDATTMALRIAIETKNLNWEQQYNFFDQKLDATVWNWIEKAPNRTVLKTAIDVDGVNDSMEMLERRCFDLLHAGNWESARVIFEGDEYQKDQARYGQLLSKLENEVREAIEAGERSQRDATVVSIAAIACVILLIIIVWWVLVRYLNNWSRKLIFEIENRARAERSLLDAKGQLQKYAEELEQMVADRTADLAKAAKRAEAFSYSLAHDLRTPVHTMQGFAEALIEDYAPVFDRTGRDYAERILESARRLESLINDLLRYTQVTTQNVEMERIDLEEAVGACIAGSQSEIAAREADVRVSGPWTAVMGNRALLQVSLSNLINNALKYVGRGVRPRVEIWSQDAGEFVRVFVRDNGIGIAPEQQHKVFEMFQRLHRQEEFSGTGLGLSIVQQAMERMNGRVDIEFSEPGKGSCFVLQLLKAKT